MMKPFLSSIFIASLVLSHCSADDSHVALQSLKTYCLDCHSGVEASGGFDISNLQEDSINFTETAKNNRLAWSKALMRVKFQEMPPRDADQPSQEERTAITEWMASLLKAPNASIEPGPHLMRRLSRFEYSATLRDLLGIHIDLAQSLPTDAAGGEGFDNAAETMLLSDLHIEKYIDAANEAVTYVSRDNAARDLLFGEEQARLKNTDQPAYDAAEVVLQRFLTRAFRRPCDDTELQRYMKIAYDSHQAGDTLDVAILAAVRSALVSPNFLFRIEQPNTGTTPEAANDYELASRLSYFLWSSMPDEELIRLASKDELHQPEVLRQQIDRMLKEGFGSHRSGILKINALAENFMTQWLGTRDLGVRVKPTAEAAPGYEYQIEFAFKREPIEFFEYMLVENRSLTDLIDSNYTFMARESVNYYDLDGKVDIKGWGQMHRVELPADSHRGGVLGMGATMAVSSYPHRTSPVLRGRWLLETFFDATLPPPPPNIPNLDAVENSHQDVTKLSLRERLEQHRADPTCAGCHDRIDPIGFALENYSVSGLWREEDQGHKINASATLENGRTIDGVSGLKNLLMERKHEFARVIVRKLLGYALGRGLQNSDHYYVETILDRAAAKDYQVREIVYGIVESEPFLYKAPLKPSTTPE